MENKDRKTDYQEVVRAGNQKWQMVEITVRIFFFCFTFLFIIFCIYRKFSSPTSKKSPASKVSIPTQNPNFT